MAIVDTNVINGPSVQADGTHKGSIEFIFDDGRRVERRLVAADLNDWTNQLADMPAKVEAEQQIQDAAEAVEADEEVAPYKQANAKQLAVAYLRRAWNEEDPYKAFLKFSRFNDYRLAQGLTLTQVKAHLMDAGLKDEEWTGMLAAYQWLSNAGRVTAMQAYQDVLIGWPDHRG